MQLLCTADSRAARRLAATGNTGKNGRLRWSQQRHGEAEITSLAACTRTHTLTAYWFDSVWPVEWVYDCQTNFHQAAAAQIHESWKLNLPFWSRKVLNFKLLNMLERKLIYIFANWFSTQVVYYVFLGDNMRLFQVFVGLILYALMRTRWWTFSPFAGLCQQVKNKQSSSNKILKTDLILHFP